MARIKLDLAALKSEQQEISDFLARPDAFSSPDYTKKTRRLNELAEIISLVERQNAVRKQLDEATDLARGDDELAELAKEEIPTLETEYQHIDDKLFEFLAPKDP